MRTFFPVMLIAILLRIQGLSWSLPNGDHFATYHPDEVHAIRTLLVMNIRNGELNPHEFMYGSLSYYMNLATFHVSQLVMGHAIRSLVSWTDPMVRLGYLSGRWNSVILSLLTVASMFWILRRRWGPWIATTASLIMAICPLAAYHAHFATVDSGLMLWCWLAVCALTEWNRVPSRRNLGMTAIFTGLAIGTKYPAVILGVPIGCHLWMQRRDRKLSADQIAAFLGILAATFVIVMPYAILDAPTFLRAVSYIFVKFPQKIDAGTGSGFLHLVQANLLVGLDWPLCLVTLLSLAGAAYRVARSKTLSIPDRRCLALHLCWIVSFGALLSWSKVSYQRYLLPLLPSMIFVSVVFIERLKARAQIRFGRSGMVWIYGLGVTVLLHTASYAQAQVVLFSGASPQDQALTFIRSKIVPGTKVATLMALNFSQPPISPFNASPWTYRGLEKWQKTADFALLSVDRNTERFLVEKPDYLIATNFDVSELRNLRNPALPAVMQALDNDYQIAATFERSSKWLGIPYGWKEPPLDWLYLNPTIWVFERKGTPKSPINN